MRLVLTIMAAVAVFTGALPSCAPLVTRPAAPTPTPIAPVKVTVAYGQTAPTHLPLWYAVDNGVFKQHGLDVNPVLITGGTKVYAALVANDVQFAHAGGGESLTAAAEGADIVVVAMLNPLWSFRLMVSPEIKTPADLRGKNIAHGVPGGSTEIALRLVLPRLGLNPDRDVNLINLPNNNGTTAALLAGKVQAGLLEPPDSVTLERQGFHALVDLASLQLPAAQNGISVQRSYLGDNRPIVQHYIDSMVDAIGRLKNDETGSVAVLEKYLKSEDDDLMRQTYRYYAQQVIPGLPFPRPDQFVTTQAAIGQINSDVDSLDVATLLDPTLVQGAADRGLDR